LRILIHATDTFTIWFNFEANETIVTPPFAPGILDLEVVVKTLRVCETASGWAT